MRCSCLVLLGLLGCAGVRSDGFREAVLPPGAVQEAFRAEHGWRHAWARDREDAGPWWQEHRNEGSRVLVLAAHTEGEPGTGGLAYALASHARVNAVYGVRKAPFDPLPARGGEFEEALRRLIAATRPALIVDLRASRPQAADVDFGTGDGAWTRGTPALATLAEALRAEGVSHLTRDALPPRGAYAARLAREAPYLRLTVNPARLPVATHDGARFRMDGRDAAQAQRFAQLLQGLVRGLRALESTD